MSENDTNYQSQDTTSAPPAILVPGTKRPTNDDGDSDVERQRDQRSSAVSFESTTAHSRSTKRAAKKLRSSLGFSRPLEEENIVKNESSAYSTPQPESSAPVSVADGMIVDKSEAGSPAPAPAPAPAPSAELHQSFVPLLRLAGPLLEFQLSLASSPSDEARTRMKVVIDMLAELVRKSGEGEGGGN